MSEFIKKILSEVFDGKNSYEIIDEQTTGNTIDMLAYDGSNNSIVITFMFSSGRVVKNDNVEIQFSVNGEIDREDGDTEIQTAANYMKIMATVLEAIKDVVRKYDPIEFYFSSHDNRMNRIYKYIAGKIGGYNLINSKHGYSIVKGK